MKTHTHLATAPPVPRMNRRLRAGLLAAAATLAPVVQAAPFTTQNLQFTWEAGDTPGNTRDGGIGALVARDADFPLGENFFFHVQVAPAGDGTSPVANWITPLAGSGISFAPIDLYAYWGGTFYTSIGKGEVYCNGSCPGDSMWSGLSFMGVGFEFDQVAAAAPLPEPASLALAATALLALTGARRRRTLF